MRRDQRVAATRPTGCSAVVRISMAVAGVLGLAGFVLSAASAATASPPTILYVDNVNGTATTGCTQPGADACQTIQEGIDAAQALSESVTVDVAGSSTVYDESDSIDSVGGKLTLQGIGTTSPTINDGAVGSDLTVQGTAEIDDFIISGGSTSQDGGGGVFNEGSVTLNGDTFSGNSTLGGKDGIGGGALLSEGSSATLDGDTFSGNSSPLDGGAIFNLEGALYVTDSTFSGDSAGEGGAILSVFGSLTMANDTLTNEQDGGAAAIETQYSNTTLTNDTLFNADPGHDGLLVEGNAASVANSIFDESPCGYISGGSVTDVGGNVADDATCFEAGAPNAAGSFTDQSNIGLSTLASNGSSGPETFSIPESSVAFDAVPNADCSVATDERGEPRPAISGGRCDAGAYELQPGTITQAAPLSDQTTVGTAYVGQLEATGVFGTATFTQSSGDPDLVVDGNGAISAPDTLPTGDYSASGTDTDGFNNGSWSFTLDVVDPKPTVSSVNPSSGTLNGGQSITIDGTGFVLGAQVHIAQGHGPSVSGGAVVATNVVVVSSDVITATTPAATLAGSFNLFVVTPGGISAPTAGDLYRYKDPVPTVSGISPTSGSVSGGQPITITGTGFVSGAKVEIGRGGGPGPTAARATNVDVVSSTEITATTGATSVAGSGYVFVQTPGGISVHNTGAKYKYS